MGVLVTGGGVQDAGTLTLTRAAVRDNALHTGEATLFTATGNHSEGGPGGVTCLSLSCYTFPGGQGRGGGVFASGAVTITDSSVAGNTARGGAGRNASPAVFSGYYLQSGGGGAMGGGVRATSTATLAIERSTLAGNVAVGGVGGAGLPVPTYVPGAVGGASTGGALLTDVAATVTNSTVTENSAAGGAGGEPGGAVGAASGGALVANAGIALAHGTVSANTGGTEVAVGAGSSSIANSILAASAGRAANSLPTDQRGVARPAIACDSGAFEASE